MPGVCMCVLVCVMHVCAYVCLYVCACVCTCMSVFIAKRRMEAEKRIKFPTPPGPMWFICIHSTWEEDPEELRAHCFSRGPERLARGSLPAQSIIRKRVNGKEGAFLLSALLAHPVISAELARLHRLLVYSLFCCLHSVAHQDRLGSCQAIK